MIRFIENIFYIAEGFFHWIESLIIPMPFKYKRRYLICMNCPHRKGRTCGICGCFLRAKVWVHYPIAKDGLSIGGCPDNPPRW